MNEQTTDPHAEDRKFIMNPDKWPRWPHLPMKRPSKKPGVWPELATLTDNPSNFDGPLKFPVTMRISDGASPFKIKEEKIFNSVEEILADGWIVD